MSLVKEVEEIGKHAVTASYALAKLSTRKKNAILFRIAFFI